VALTLAGNFAAGMLAGRSARLSPRASSNIGLTIVSRGEFSIIMANLGRNGGLLPILQPFAALYVLILAILGPLLTMQSRFVFEQLNKIFRWQKPPEMKEDPPRADGGL
jgi:CPA2 family monovalent cation:H+ antiporter-2